MKPYKYIYYQLFRLWSKKRNEKENAAINAVITMTFLLYINIFSILLICFTISGKEIIDLPSFTTAIKISVSMVILGGFLLNYYFLARKKRHIKIVKEFDHETEDKRKKGLIIIFLYIIISLGILFYFFLFTDPIK